MPSYRDSLPEEDRWALSYYVLALSAYKDPLTWQPLTIADTDRAALNDLDAGGRYAGRRPMFRARRSAQERPSSARRIDDRNKLPPKETEPCSDLRSPDPMPAPC